MEYLSFQLDSGKHKVRLSIVEALATASMFRFVGIVEYNLGDLEKSARYFEWEKMLTKSHMSPMPGILTLTTPSIQNLKRIAKYTADKWPTELQFQSPAETWGEIVWKALDLADPGELPEFLDSCPVPDDLPDFVKQMFDKLEQIARDHDPFI